MSTDYNILYETIMQNISIIVKNEINEAYNNYILEQYDAKDILDKVTDTSVKTSKIFYAHLKKVLVIIIKELQQTNEYKTAEKIMTAYKKKVQKYIDEHKKITPRRMLKIVISVLTLYGGVSMVQDCKNLLRMLEHDVQTLEQKKDSINNDISVDNDTEEFVEELEEIEDELSYKTSDKELLNSKYPADIYKTDKNFSFTSSKNAQDFIKKHERCLLYPYYATPREEKLGIVTIGYGHVILKTDGALYKKVQDLKQAGLIKQSFIKDKQNKTILNPRHCKQIITSSEADALFLKDIKIAEDRAFRSIQNMDADANVKGFLLYNQDIRDGLTSLCYNAGFLKQNKYEFIKNGLSKCRYDYKNNCINVGDYNVTFQLFKNLKTNANRRIEEYNLFFMNANKPLTV